MSVSPESVRPPKKPKRRWLQFSLRGLLLLTVIVAWPVSRYAKRLEDQRRWELSRVVPTAWDIKTGYNILWSANLGSQSYGTPVVAGGKVFVGTNNGQGYVPRFPSTLDAGVLICFDASDGKFLWQHTNLKLPTGRVHDWPLQGVCATPTVEGDRLWYVSNRCEVVCLDTEGFQDRQNDGPFTQEDVVAGDEADVVWKLDMMGALGVKPHNMSCSPVALLGDQAFVVTSNGVDESHTRLPAPRAPSFISLDKHTGRLLWSDSSPGANILHGQWGSPVVGEFGGVRQVVFLGGDGWLYSFDADATAQGKTTLLWKFDANPKASVWRLGGRGTRNNLIARPVVYDGLLYFADGQDPEHGEGPGRLWCIDPTKRGDVERGVGLQQSRSPTAHRPQTAASLCRRGGRLRASQPQLGRGLGV